jgi:hypothetical protein
LVRLLSKYRPNYFFINVHLSVCLLADLIFAKRRGNFLFFLLEQELASSLPKLWCCVGLCGFGNVLASVRLIYKSSPFATFNPYWALL